MSSSSSPPSDPKPGQLLSGALALLAADPVPHDDASARAHGQAEVFAYMRDPDFPVWEATALWPELEFVFNAHRKGNYFVVADYPSLVDLLDLDADRVARCALHLAGLWQRPGADGTPLWSDKPLGLTAKTRIIRFDGLDWTGSRLIAAKRRA